jgi:hypothetical protein
VPGGAGTRFPAAERLIMDGENDCKACEALVPISEEEISAIFGKVTSVRDVKLASERLYAERLAICETCPGLVGGTTCKHCGCFVRVKAKLAAAKCPAAGHPRW